jgi:hypothetical protein
MRLIRWILSSIVFSVTFVIILAAEYATLALLTLPGTLPGGNNIVERVHLFPDPSESNITYYDAIDFWGIDMSESIEIAISNPEYEIRSWFEWEWWSENMKWADTTVSLVKAVVVPPVAPIYEVKEMYVYFGRDLYDPVFEEQFHKEFGRNIVYAGTVTDYFNGNFTNISINQFKFLYNTERKIAKYNATAINEETGQTHKVYQKFIEKFVNYRGNLNGTRLPDNYTGEVLANQYSFESVDAVTAFLFYQLFLALVLSAYFTYQNPIVINRNSNGENEVEGRIFPRVPKVTLGKRKPKKEKEVK